MRCPDCGLDNPAGSLECASCRTHLNPQVSPQAETIVLGEASLDIPARPPRSSTTQNRSAQHAAEDLLGESRWSDPDIQPPTEEDLAYADLRPGAVLGGRYEIVRLVGEGGMGAVYQARDREVDRFVALKVVRPELAGDPSMLRRFRQELVLARQITHPNVVRIFDLGIVNGLRFISMEFIDGEQLSSVLEEKGKLPPKEAAEIVLQVCRGLAATHEQGVVHRDLKPPNVMIEKDGRVVVMDFGIARAGDGSSGTPTVPGAPITAGSGSMTQAGAILGTPLYMSPEQAKGEHVDARSDLFTVGIIFYELLTGNLPFLGKTVKESLRKRCEEAALPPAALNPQIPKPLNDIVLKCLATSPEDRFQNTGELVRALEVFLGIAKPTARRWKWMVGALAASLAASGLFIAYEQSAARNAEPHAPVKILIADLENKTLDPVFNGALEPLLSIAMEGAPFITSYDRGHARQTGTQLQSATARLDASAARQIAQREGVGVVLSGVVALENGKYRLTVDALDSVKGTVITSAQATAGRKNEVMRSLGTVAAAIREGLGDNAPKAKRLAAAANFAAVPLDAAQDYAQAQQLQAQGKWEDAGRFYGKTVELDQNFALAYAGMASVLAAQGRFQEAQKDYEIALGKLDRMPDREKLRTRGRYLLVTRNYRDAADQFKALTAAYPVDAAGLSDLADAYFLERDMPAALEASARAAEVYPNDVRLRGNQALYAVYAGDFTAAIRDGRELLKSDPQSGKTLLTIALAQLGQGDATGAAQTWETLAQTGSDGASTAALGLADLALYEGRYDDVIRTLPKAIAADAADKNFLAGALKRVALAQAYLASGARPNALGAADAALRDRSDAPVAFPAAQVFIDAGEERKAEAIADTLRSSSDPEPRAYAGVIDGLIKLKHKDYQAAVTAFQGADKLSEAWPSQLAVGRAYLEAAAFPEADTELDNAVKRRGEASALFLDGQPTWRYLPPAFYYRGRAREGLHVPSAGEDYKTFLEFKARSQPDPLVADARQRLAKK